jgi:hypothetical protein
MLRRFGVVLGSAIGLLMPQVRVRTAEDESKTERERAINAILRQHPPADPQHIREQLLATQKDEEP